MNKLGLGAIIIVVFFVGYGIGTQPTTQQLQTQANVTQYTQDITVLADKYSQVFNLCEQKYTFLLQGNNASAYALYGQIDLILKQINQITAKYNVKAL